MHAGQGAAVDLLRSAIGRQLAGSHGGADPRSGRPAARRRLRGSQPGPNYSKTYAADQFADAAIARELLTILHEVYGYAWLPKLKVDTE